MINQGGKFFYVAKESIANEQASAKIKLINSVPIIVEACADDEEDDGEEEVWKEILPKHLAHLKNAESKMGLKITRIYVSSLGRMVSHRCVKKKSI